MKRVFLAIKPDDRTRLQIQKIQDVHCTSGKRVHIDDLHITLAFIGDVNNDQLQRLKNIMEKVSVRPFVVKLGKLNFWKNNGILSLIPDNPPEELLCLHKKLHQQLTDNGFFVEKRKYFPHVTLSRKSTVVDLNNLVNSMTCNVVAYCLFESRLVIQAPRYTIISKKLLADS